MDDKLIAGGTGFFSGLLGNVFLALGMRDKIQDINKEMTAIKEDMKEKISERTCEKTHSQIDKRLEKIEILSLEMHDAVLLMANNRKKRNGDPE